MREVVIVDSVRTGLAKSFRGKFNMTRPDDMAAHCVDALLARNDINPASVEDCIVGAGSNEGAQGYNIGRNVAVLSRLGTGTAGMTLNRFCSSGLQAIAIAANQIASGCSDIIVAGGVESISLTMKKRQHRQSDQPAAQGAGARDLFPHGPDGRDRCPSLPGQPRGTGPLRLAEPAAHRQGPGGRVVQ
nr:hypothetical protein GCM10020185_09260 [Pseudomonas brassicacearum subsp. brassicacearum]